MRASSYVAGCELVLPAFLFNAGFLAFDVCIISFRAFVFAACAFAFRAVSGFICMVHVTSLSGYTVALVYQMNGTAQIPVNFKSASAYGWVFGGYDYV